MKAYYRKQYGVEHYHLTDVSKPIPKADEVLLRVHATSLNRTDEGFLLGKPWIVKPIASGIWKLRQPTLGCEFAGEVVEIGSKVTRFQVGDNVFGFDDVRFGAHAEFMVLQENAGIALMPASFTYAQAAVLAEGAHYALCDLRAANVSTGQRVLIHGGTGAIGSAAFQLAQALGAEVTVVCAKTHFQKLEALGAKSLFDYTEGDFVQRILASGLPLFDLVFDAVGKSTFGACKPLLTPHGVYISTELGPWVQNPLLALWTPFFSRQKVLFPIPTVSYQDLEWIATQAALDRFTPLIDRIIRFEEIPTLFEYVHSGQKIGNVVVAVSDPVE